MILCLLGIKRAFYDSTSTWKKKAFYDSTITWNKRAFYDSTFTWNKRAFYDSTIKGTLYSNSNSNSLLIKKAP